MKPHKRKSPDIPSPCRTVTTQLRRLPDCFLEAIKATPSRIRANLDTVVRVETFKTGDIQHAIEEVWQWGCTLDALESRDKTRVEDIIDLLASGEPQWPYISHLADTVAELFTVTHVSYEVPIINVHGDGWHRIIAAVELKLPTIEVLFIERH